MCPEQRTRRFVAQLVEHVTLNHGVEGSNPSEPTREGDKFRLIPFFRRLHFPIIFVSLMGLAKRGDVTVSFVRYTQRSVLCIALIVFVLMLLHNRLHPRGGVEIRRIENCVNVAH